MNLYVKLTSYLVITVVWFGAIVPHLISSASDLLLALGVVAVFAYPVFTLKLFKTELTKLKGKLNELS